MTEWNEIVALADIDLHQQPLSVLSLTMDALGCASCGERMIPPKHASDDGNGDKLSPILRYCPTHPEFLVALHYKEIKT